MAEAEFIGPGGIVRQTILNNQGPATIINASASPQWTSVNVKPEVVVTASTSQGNSFYPSTYEYEIQAPTGGKKVKHRTIQQQNNVSVSLAPVEIKPIPQTIIAQCSNAWTTNNSNTVTMAEGAYQTIKWDPSTPITVMTTKPSTLNTTGLQFISAPAVTAAATSINSAGGNGMNVVIHGGRKNTPIIETFKCEVCNQIFSNMNSLQSHVAQVHEADKRQGKKAGFSASTFHCEFKYSGLTLADPSTGSIHSPSATTIATQVAAAQHIPTHIIGPVVSGINTGGATYIQAPTNLTITSIGGTGNIAAAAATNTVQTSPTGIILTKNGKIRKEKKRNWECGVCRNRFSRKDHLAKHVSAVHEKIRPFDCMQCGQKFSQKHHLRAHMLARHEDDKMAAKAFACQQCPKRFTRNDHLERHIESVHEKRKQFECTVCAHQFARKHHLSKHILAVHAKVKPYGCNQCEQSFLQRHHLGAHIMSVHQPPIQEEPDGSKSYVCAICSHRFKRKDHLKKHVETVHEKTRAFQCMLCERRFGQKYHLAIHVSAVHEGKKPYACSMCSHKSARKSGLQRHMRTVHNIKNPQIASQPMPTPPGVLANQVDHNHHQIQHHPHHETVTYTVNAH